MDFVEHLKSSIDIVKVVGEYVNLKKVGATARYVGLCPFHTEKSPSFGINSALQYYKCFGCGAGGDVLKFVQEIERISFYEALKLLAEKNGVPMPRRAEYSDPASKLSAAILEMHEIAAQFYQANLQSPGGSEARAYITRRGISESQVGEFALGYSDANGNTLLRRLESFTAEQLESSGLAGKSEDGRMYDRFRGRLMFPIHNESGKVIGFGGRALRDGQEPKYLNSPESPVYHKSAVLYNLHRAKQAIRKVEHAVLVEGYMDVIGVSAAGVQEVVASCGTALTNTQVRVIKRLSSQGQPNSAGSIIMNFDPDTAGANAAEKSIQMLLEEGLRIRVLTLENGLDPDEYVKRFGADIYRAKLEKASGYFHWLADRARKKFDMRGAEGRMDALKFLLPVIQKISDKLERAAIASDVASYLGVDQGVVLDQFKKSASDRKAPPQSATRQPSIPAVERLLLNGLLHNAAARDLILGQLEEMPALERFVTRSIFEAAIQTFAAQGSVPFAQLEARLTESDKNILHALIATEEAVEEESIIAQAQACLKMLQRADGKAPRDDLKQQIKVAEREGRMEDALRLYADLDKLERGARLLDGPNGVVH